MTESENNIHADIVLVLKSVSSTEVSRKPVDRRHILPVYGDIEIEDW